MVKEDYRGMTKTILFLAANPLSTERLRLDEEVREIDEGLRRARQREQFKLYQRWAVRPEDFRRAMLDLEPDIIHFSGHGEGIRGIVLENNLGQPTTVSQDALRDFFALFPTVQCVVLNACYSSIQAEAIVKHVRYVIGIHHQIDDTLARIFSVSFYDGLGAGKSVEFSYKLGCNSLQMVNALGNSIPVLLKNSQIADILQPDVKQSNSLTEGLSQENLGSKKVISTSGIQKNLQER